MFGRLRDRMPSLARLAARGTCGTLRSTDPPITLPAWVSMFTGQDPGELGLYGFRNRADHGYGPLQLATSAATDAPRVWDRLGWTGRTSYLLGVPGTFPPWPVRGRMVAGPLAPDPAVAVTHPPGLAAEIDADSGYRSDVTAARDGDPARLLAAIRQMTTGRFRLARAWAREPHWDLMVVVEIGLDRLHHAFWRFVDPDHPRHQATGPHASAVSDYHALLDREITALLDAAGPGTAVLVVSDHGARSALGGFRINTWLVEQGDLVLHREPRRPTRLAPGMVDWSRTRAWAAGGYCGRVFFNVAGREPQGVLPPEHLETYRSDLAGRLETALAGTRVLEPARIYRKLRGAPPDLLVYFGDLAWRALDEVGTNDVLAPPGAGGLDDANHAPDGILIASPGVTPPSRNGKGWHITQVAGMIMSFFGLD